MTARVLRVRLGRLLAVVSAALIAFLTLTPSTSTPIAERFCIVCGPLGGVDALLNLALFAPLGFGLGLAGVRPSRALATICLGTLAIEILQMELVSGRDASVGDLVMNGTGGILGYSISRRLDALAFPRPRAAVSLLAGWTLLWGCVQLAAGFAAVPRVTESRLFGQLAEPYGPALVRFRGDVLRASVGTDFAIPNGRLAASDSLRQLLMRPEMRLSAAIVEHVRADGYAPIVRIVDAELRELAVIAQDGSSLIFGVRTGADVLRLRPVRYRLPHVLPTAGGGDTTALEADRSRGGVRIRAQGRRVDIDATIPYEMAGAWRLIYPRRVYAGPGIVGRAISVAWATLLVLPAAYFLVFAVRPRDRMSIARLALVHFLLLGVAMFGVARNFGVDIQWWEWLAMGAGYAIGLGLGSLGVKRPRSTLQA